MMRKMRENTKVVLWIVVSAFVVTIFAVWGLDLQTGSGSGDPNVIGKVNGVAISRSQYQLVYQQLAEQFRASSPNQSLSYAQEEFVRAQAWDQLVYAVLTDQEIRRLGITVTDEEIVAYLRTSPPEEIRQYFVDEQGNFDNNRYQAELSNPANDWTNLEQLARDRIPRAKLNGYLSAQVHVSEEEIRRAYDGEAVELKLQYAMFPVEDTVLEDFTPSDEEIEEYYRKHIDEFEEPDKVRLDIVRIPLEPSRSDFDDAAFTARHVREKLESGDTFADLAKTFSDAPTAFADGNTGFIVRGQRDDAYFDALDALSPGEIGAPVLTEEGYFVLKLLEKRAGDSGQSEYSAQEVFVETALSRQTVDSLYDVASEVRTRALETDLQTAAAERQLEALAPEPFPEGAPVGTIGFVPSLSNFGFQAELGALSEVLRDENTIFIARVAERLPSSVRPLSEVRDVVSGRVIHERKKALTEMNAGAFFQKARASDFDTSARTYGVAVKTPEPFRAQDDLDGFGPNSELAEAALSVKKGAVAPPIEVGGSFVVFQLLERSEIDPEDYKERIPVLRDLLRNQKIQAYVGDWYESLKAASRIEDLRT
ncbi:MAG: SurA N-terminal domain-containing protein [Candidatus Krumholzibacteriia bacterium]